MSHIVEAVRLLREASAALRNSILSGDYMRELSNQLDVQANHLLRTQNQVDMYFGVIKNFEEKLSTSGSMADLCAKFDEMLAKQIPEKSQDILKRLADGVESKKETAELNGDRYDVAYFDAMLKDLKILLGEEEEDLDE